MDKTEGVAWFWGELQVALFPPFFVDVHYKRIISIVPLLGRRQQEILLTGLDYLILFWLLPVDCYPLHFDDIFDG